MSPEKPYFTIREQYLAGILLFVDQLQDEPMANSSGYINNTSGTCLFILFLN
jgi:hypothetical protein